MHDCCPLPVIRCRLLPATRHHASPFGMLTPIGVAGAISGHHAAPRCAACAAPRPGYARVRAVARPFSLILAAAAGARVLLGAIVLLDNLKQVT